MGIRDPVNKRSIEGVHVYHDDEAEEVIIAIWGRTPKSVQKVWINNSPGNRYAYFSPAKARRVAYPLLDLAKHGET